ncbi:MAG: DNA-directed RNA polymerase subunit alpha, partial [Thermodesulfobacteriota bacterium]
GFGITIGNSLRRILLSSLQGAAITSVRIDGVQHEFSSMPGVKEDVADIILNLKQVRFKLHSEEPKVVKIEAKGEGLVKAGNIICDATVEVLNPDCHIATLSKDGKLNAELAVKTGKGYVPAGMNKEEGQPIGTIPIDSIFSPVTKVNYNVTQARVGRQTDYDKLTMEIWTTGTLNPQDALALAAKIMTDQLSLFITFEEEEEELEEAMETQPTFNDNLFKTVDELELSVRSANCLKNANIKYLGELVQRTEQEMLRTKNFGRKSLNEIKEIISSMNLEFGVKLPGFPTREALDKMMTERKDVV